MKTIKMGFRGFVFDVNPSSIKLEYSKSVASKVVLFSTGRTQEVSFDATKISGSGKFVGKNAREYAYSLESVFKHKGSSFLFIPDGTPIKAFFTKLNISYNAEENSVSYSFEFVEDYQGERDSYDFGFTYALDGENLYDIANRTNVDVADLFSHNDYMDLFSVEGGDKVWLC